MGGGSLSNLRWAFVGVQERQGILTPVALMGGATCVNGKDLAQVPAFQRAQLGVR